MIDYQEAVAVILKNTKRLEPMTLPLNECFGKILAQNVYSPFAFPNFDNSAVDGFAVRTSRNQKKEFCFKGEVPTGDAFEGKLEPGEAMHVFTGAALPAGTEAVVMQENAQRINGSVLIQKQPKRFENIRFQGEDFQPGQRIVKKGVCLEPHHIAVLAAAGYAEASVYPSPRVVILVTGNELLEPGAKLQFGKIYDSNTPLLHALVRKVGGFCIVLNRVSDKAEKIQEVVREGLKYDVLIIAGGVSVGKYDLVKEALLREGIQEKFWKVDIKPGKPLFFGKKNKTIVFGLPGNPVSVFVCFEEFVRPALLKAQGKSSARPLIEGPLSRDYENGSRRHFVRVVCRATQKGYAITPLKGQGSHRVGELAKANALLEVEANAVLKKGQLVKVKFLEEKV